MVQTGMAAPYGGGVFPPPVNGVAGVVGAAGAAGEVKPPPPVPVKEDNSGAPQQPPPSGPQVPPPAGAPHPTAPGAPTAASFSPPPPPNGVDQQAIVSFAYIYIFFIKLICTYVYFFFVILYAFVRHFAFRRDWSIQFVVIVKFG